MESFINPSSVTNGQTGLNPNASSASPGTLCDKNPPRSIYSHNQYPIPSSSPSAVSGTHPMSSPGGPMPTPASHMTGHGATPNNSMNMAPPMVPPLSSGHNATNTLPPVSMAGGATTIAMLNVPLQCTQVRTETDTKRKRMLLKGFT